MSLSAAFVQGFGLCAGLIVAIGAQNAHVLRLVLLRQHVVPVLALCMLIDAVLITAGVSGLGALIERSPAWAAGVRWGGAAFLVFYALRAWRQVGRPEALLAAAGDQPPLSRAIRDTLMVSLLNPHVYLDTVVLIGAVGAQHDGASRWCFALGAISASIGWFQLLGAGASRLAPWFAQPRAWQGLHLLIGWVMAAQALWLIGESV